MSELSELCEKLNIKISSELGKNEKTPDDFETTNGYRVTLTFESRFYTCDFFMGAAHKEGPNVADVLICLCIDANFGEQSFEEFCSDLGYDTDSRKAYATWEACRASAQDIRAFLGEHFEQLSRAEH